MGRVRDCRWWWEITTLSPTCSTDMKKETKYHKNTIDGLSTQGSRYRPLLKKSQLTGPENPTQTHPRALEVTRT